MRGQGCKKCFPHSDVFNEVSYSIIVGVPGRPGRHSRPVLVPHQRWPTDLGSYLYIKKAARCEGEDGVSNSRDDRKVMCRTANTIMRV